MSDKKVRRPLRIQVQGDAGLTEAEIWWWEPGGFWIFSHEHFSVQTRLLARPDLDGGDAYLDLKVVGPLDRDAARHKGGYLIQTRYHPSIKRDARRVVAWLRRMNPGQFEDSSESRPPTAPPSTPPSRPSLSGRPPRRTHRRKPASASLPRPQLSPGDPPSLLVRFRDSEALRRALVFDADPPMCRVAATEGLKSGNEVLLVFELPSHTYLQCRSRVISAVKGELLLDLGKMSSRDRRALRDG